MFAEGWIAGVEYVEGLMKYVAEEKSKEPNSTIKSRQMGNVTIVDVVPKKQEEVSEEPNPTSSNPPSDSPVQNLSKKEEPLKPGLVGNQNQNKKHPIQRNKKSGK